jgi:hypothetical protein
MAVCGYSGMRRPLVWQWKPISQAAGRCAELEERNSLHTRRQAKIFGALILGNECQRKEVADMSKTMMRVLKIHFLGCAFAVCVAWALPLCFPVFALPWPFQPVLMSSIAIWGLWRAYPMSRGNDDFANKMAKILDATRAMKDRRAQR